MDKVGSPEPASGRTASPTFDRGLEERLAEALRQVAALKLELARVRAAYAALLTSQQQTGATVTMPEPPQAARPRRSEDFDWETWARVTKARIRGEEAPS